MWAIKSWGENGRTRNLLGLGGGFSWLLIAGCLWHGIDALSEFNRISHESLAGLAIVMLKGILLLASLPILLCLACISIYVGVVLGICGILCAIAAKIFGLFHPFLTWVPLTIYFVFAVRFMWETLDNDSLYF